VVQRFLDSRQAWAMPLSLRRACNVPILSFAIGSLLILNLPPQTLQVEVAQCIGTQTAGLEVLVGCDVGILLQQVGYPGEDGGGYAIGMEALEQKQRLEIGVGGEASIHPPGVCSARAMGLGQDGSQRDERERLFGADGHRMRLGRWAQLGGEIVRDGLSRRLMRKLSQIVVVVSQCSLPPAALNGSPGREPIRRVEGQWS
jgi:hypothetical protein